MFYHGLVRTRFSVALGIVCLIPKKSLSDFLSQPVRILFSLTIFYTHKNSLPPLSLLAQRVERYLITTTTNNKYTFQKQTNKQMDKQPLLTTNTPFKNKQANKLKNKQIKTKTTTKQPTNQPDQTNRRQL